MIKQKLTLLDDWLEAIEELRKAYSEGFSPADLVMCPLCKVHRQEQALPERDEISDDCYCPWMVFEDKPIFCYGTARGQSKEERLTRLKDWRRRILRMKRRRKNV